MEIKTMSGLTIATNFVRIVHGGRGDYAEFLPEQMVLSNLRVPQDAQWRLNSRVAYYDEHRSNDDAYVKFYHQKKLVKYADYRIGMWYALPSALKGLTKVDSDIEFGGWCGDV